MYLKIEEKKWNRKSHHSLQLNYIYIVAEILNPAYSFSLNFLQFPDDVGMETLNWTNGHGWTFN